MKIKSQKLLIAFAFIFLFYVDTAFSSTQNGTLHAIMLIDEHSDIAPACISDKIKMEEEVQVIAQKTRMVLNLQVIDYTKAAVEQFVAQLAVRENDVIFFYFTGHGYRYEGQQSCGKYPYLYVTKTAEHLYDAGICLEEINAQLKEKGARLVISLADCCNNILPFEEPIAMSSQFVGEVYKKLFLLSEGFVFATSSLPGQFSFATNEGGYFTNSFLHTIRSLGATESELEKLNWEQVLKKTSVQTILNSESKQRPQWDSDIKVRAEKEIPGMVTFPVKNN